MELIGQLCPFRFAPMTALEGANSPTKKRTL